MSVIAVGPSFNLPWDLDRDDLRKFKRWLLICVVSITVGGAVIPLLPVPEVDREELEELPPQLARILLEKPEPVVPPPPPKPEVKEEEKPVPEEKPEVIPERRNPNRK